MNVWLSSNLITDNSGGKMPDIHQSGAGRDKPDFVPGVEIPWVVRQTNTWKGMLDQLMPTDVSTDPPTLTTNTAVRPTPTGFAALGETEMQDWMTRSFKHHWRRDE
jgi:hypothetical protein